MSITSDWPLPRDGIRFLTPRQLVNQLASHPLSQSLYPIAMGYYPLAHHHHMRRLEHDDYLLIYCTAGQGILHINPVDEARQYEVSSGDIIILPKHMSHSYHAHDQYPWSIYWLHFDGSLAKAFCQHLQIAAPCQNIGLQPRVINILETLTELRNSKYQLSNFIYASHQLQSLLSYLSLLLKQHSPQNSKTFDLQQIESIMQQHLHLSLSLDVLAEEVKLSKYHLAKKFRHLVGQSPIQYFINMKMQHACFLLDSSNLSVKQVSADLGYDDTYYFSRLFKKTIGLSPDQYRKSKYR